MQTIILKKHVTSAYTVPNVQDFGKDFLTKTDHLADFTSTLLVHATIGLDTFRFAGTSIVIQMKEGILQPGNMDGLTACLSEMAGILPVLIDTADTEEFRAYYRSMLNDLNQNGINMPFHGNISLNEALCTAAETEIKQFLSR